MMLDETREEARVLRDNPNAPVTFGDSLAAELEMSGVCMPSPSANKSEVTQQERSYSNEILHANAKGQCAGLSKQPHERILSMAKYVNSISNVSKTSYEVTFIFVFKLV